MRESESAVVVAVDAEHMRAIGGAIAAGLRTVRGAPVIIAIAGELGAGKTTLVGGLLNELGLRGPARSPTYTLIEPYELEGRSIQHLDLYRLADPAEVEALGLRDLLIDDAVLLIEWPERGADFIPIPDLHLSIVYSAQRVTGRDIELAAATAAGAAIQAIVVGAVKR
jgi:tRNA threonylcarbamoyladenosine biosynthesis protein TsaE